MIHLILKFGDYPYILCKTAPIGSSNIRNHGISYFQPSLDYVENRTFSVRECTCKECLIMLDSGLSKGLFKVKGLKARDKNPELKVSFDNNPQWLKVYNNYVDIDSKMDFMGRDWHIYRYYWTPSQVAAGIIDAYRNNLFGGVHYPNACHNTGIADFIARHDLFESSIISDIRKQCRE